MDQKEIKKMMTRKTLESELNCTIDQRVERYLEIEHQGVIGGHYFAEASSQCIYLYRDGYFISAVMVSQSVNEGIVRFVAERNNISLYSDSEKGKTKSTPELIDELEQNKFISHTCAEASRGICKSFRNDVHHMNPKVAEIAVHFANLAKRNLQDLAALEKEIFGVNIAPDGRFVLLQPKYWDIKKDGTAPVYLRLG
jgi:hypothetical protein